MGFELQIQCIFGFLFWHLMGSCPIVAFPSDLTYHFIGFPYIHTDFISMLLSVSNMC